MCLLFLLTSYFRQLYQLSIVRDIKSGTGLPFVFLDDGSPKSSLADGRRRRRCDRRLRLKSITERDKNSEDLLHHITRKCHIIY